MVKLNSKYIRELMGSKGMAMEDLAYQLGVAESTIKRILDKEVTDIQMAERIAGTLNLRHFIEITAA